MVFDLPVLDLPVLGAGAPGAGNGPLRPVSPGGGAARPRTSADLRSVVELVGKVAAPTTLLGGLAVYFGVVYVNAQAFYFGVDGSTLGLSTQDYVLRSVDALFVPIGVLAVAGIALLSTHAAFCRWARRSGRRPAVVAVTWALRLVGAALLRREPSRCSARSRSRPRSCSPR